MPYKYKKHTTVESLRLRAHMVSKGFGCHPKDDLAAELEAAANSLEALQEQSKLLTEELIKMSQPQR